MAGKGGKVQGAGRKKGSPNKSTLEIKTLIDKSCAKKGGFGAIVNKVLELALAGDIVAAKLLMEYRFGKPAQVVVSVGQGITEEAYKELVNGFVSGVTK